MSEYHVLQRLGTGGLSEILVVRRPDFEKKFAMKVLLPAYADNETYRDMLVAEGELGAKLNHPNLVQVIDIGETNGRPFIVMDLVDGIDCRTFIDEFVQKHHKHIPIPVAAFIAREVANGLDYAHSSLRQYGSPLNVVHRDISPGNILISYTGHVKVADFGVAKVEQFRDRATNDGVLKGKLRYAAPEYANHALLDHRADIFALGLLLFEMIAGRSPYGDSVVSPESLVMAIKPVPSPTS